MNRLHRYPTIARWFAWLFERHYHEGDEEWEHIVLESIYIPLVFEILESDIRDLHRNLRLLDQDIALAAEVCSGFPQVMAEKALPDIEIDELARVILDKLAEVRAVVGLHRLGLKNITFVRSPDFAALLGTATCGVEVTRLGASPLNRSIFDSISGAIDGKRRQIRNMHGEYDKVLLWISAGRDYLAAGLKERRSVGLAVLMERTARAKLIEAVTQHYSCDQLSDRGLHFILSLGKRRNDIIYPPLEDLASPVAPNP